MFLPSSEGSPGRNPGIARSKPRTKSRLPVILACKRCESCAQFGCHTPEQNYEHNVCRTTRNVHAQRPRTYVTLIHGVHTEPEFHEVSATQFAAPRFVGICFTLTVFHFGNGRTISQDEVGGSAHDAELISRLVTVRHDIQKVSEGTGIPSAPARLFKAISVNGSHRSRIPLSSPKEDANHIEALPHCLQCSLPH
jgi:hypothetical protein